MTRGALAAEVTFTVLGASAAIPVDSTLWSLPARSGFRWHGAETRAQVLRPLWQDLPPEIEQPGLFFIDEGASEWDANSWSETPWVRPTLRPAHDDHGDHA